MKSTLIPPLLLQNDLLATDPTNPGTQWKGTRTSTVILVRDDGETVFVERDIAELGKGEMPIKGRGERRFGFSGETR